MQLTQGHNNSHFYLNPFEHPSKRPGFVTDLPFRVSAHHRSVVAQWHSTVVKQEGTPPPPAVLCATEKKRRKSVCYSINPFDWLSPAMNPNYTRKHAFYLLFFSCVCFLYSTKLLIHFNRGSYICFTERQVAKWWRWIHWFPFFFTTYRIK